MSVPWSLTTTRTDRPAMMIGIGTDHDESVTAVLTAAQVAILDAMARALPQAPRYELRAGADVVAVIQTGVDESGTPDHRSTAALIERIEDCRDVAPRTGVPTTAPPHPRPGSVHESR